MPERVSRLAISATLAKARSRLIGHPGVASTAAREGHETLPLWRAKSRLASPGGGEVPTSGNRT
jgi:hypothetical protein